MFCSEKNFGQNKFLVWENIHGKKKLVWKNFGLRKILVGEILVGKNNFGLKIFLVVGKNFSRKTKLVWKKNWFWVGHFFWCENFLGRKDLYPSKPLFCLLDSSSDWVEIMLHTKNKLPRLRGGGGQVTPNFLTYFF